MSLVSVPENPLQVNAVDVKYCEQQSKLGCGFAVVEMIRSTCRSVSLNGGPKSQNELKQTILKRRGRDESKTLPDFALRRAQISWLLHPIRCQWIKHVIRPGIQHRLLCDEIDSGRPVILFLSPIPDPDPANLPKESVSYDHVVLMTGYKVFEGNDGPVNCLLVLDPQSDNAWQPLSDEDDELSRSQKLCKDGHCLVRFDELTSQGASISPHDNVNQAQKYRWAATGLLLSHLAK